MSVDLNKSALIVVLNYNGWQETLSCIDAVLKQSYKNFHILLIDNGSKDESIEKLVAFENNKKITYIKEPVNHGFAGGVNIGIKKAIKENYEYTVLLNNDAIISKNWLSILIDKLESTGSAVCTGLLLNKSGNKIESTGDSYSKFGLPFPRQRDEKANMAQESGYVFGGTAGASVYKTSLFKDIGLFDEKFFAYFEDTDISYRSQLAGHKAYYEKTALAYHDHGTTSNKIEGFTVYQSFKNLPLFLWKDVPLQLFFATAVRFYVAYSLMFVRATLRGQIKYAARGMFKSLLLFPYILRQRNIVQRKRRVTIKYMNSIIFQGIPPSLKIKINNLIGR